MAGHLYGWQESDGQERSNGYIPINELEAFLESSLEPLVEKFNEVQYSLLFFIRSFFGASFRPEVYAVGNNIINDFHELVHGIFRGRGRTVARTTRSIFELMVIFCEVCDSVESGIRYSRHASVTAQLEARIETGLSSLSGRDRALEERRLRKLKTETHAEYENALKDYGHSYEKGWSKLSFYEMCRKNNKEQFYEVYRLLSQVIHGSHGGIRGTFKEFQGVGVHRTGPSLDLSIIGYFHGINFFRQFIVDVSLRAPDLNVEPLLKHLSEALEMFPIYRKTLIHVDKHLWPDAPPASAVTIIKAYETGAFRWFLYEPGLQLAFPAAPPDGSESVAAEAVGKVRNQEIPKTPSQGNKFVVMTVSNFSVCVAPSARPVPIRALLEIPDGESLPDELFNTQ